MSTASAKRELNLVSGPQCEVLSVLAVLLCEEGKVSMGVREADVIKRSALEEKQALKHLAKLIKDKFVTSELCQVDTGGTHAHFYKINGECKIKVEMEIVDQESS